MEALEAATDLVGHCHFLFDTEQPIPENDSPANSPLHRLREEALRRRQRFCNDADAHFAAIEKLKQDAQLRAAALEQGQELAVAASLYEQRDKLSPEQVDLAVRLATASPVPRAREEALAALAGSRDPRVIDLREEVFTDLQPPAERDLVLHHAAQWAACEAGAAGCGPWNFDADSDCIYYGECHSHLPRMAYIRSRALSARHFEQMQEWLAGVSRLSGSGSG